MKRKKATPKNSPDQGGSGRPRLVQKRGVRQEKYGEHGNDG